MKRTYRKGDKGRIQQQVSLYQEHIEIIQKLIEEEYASNISGVIKKLLEEKNKNALQK